MDNKGISRSSENYTITVHPSGEVMLAERLSDERNHFLSTDILFADLVDIEETLTTHLQGCVELRMLVTAVIENGKVETSAA